MVTAKKTLSEEPNASEGIASPPGTTPPVASSPEPGADSGAAVGYPDAAGNNTDSWRDEAVSGEEEDFLSDPPVNSD